MLRSLVHTFDDRVDALVGRLRGRKAADRVFYTASALGDFGLIWVVYALLRALRGGKTNERAALRAIAATGIESVLVNVLLKAVFSRTRPLEQPDHPLPLRQPLSSSFPSGHATAAFCAATLLSDGDPLAPVYFATAAVVAASRVYVRIHHASDVAGGVVVGLVLGQVGKRLAPMGRGRRGRGTLARSWR
ncbi:MAG: phosphoesterase PA-phosphatase related [Acidimicrobiaceae bacterium]|nr:phosphoesterase PA-phosphatase related [Acidimicrobiaceae bacterium]